MRWRCFPCAATSPRFPLFLGALLSCIHPSLRVPSSELVPSGIHNSGRGGPVLCHSEPREAAMNEQETTKLCWQAWEAGRWSSSSVWHYTLNPSKPPPGQRVSFFRDCLPGWKCCMGRNSSVPWPLQPLTLNWLLSWPSHIRSIIFHPLLLLQTWFFTFSFYTLMCGVNTKSMLSNP